MRDVQCIIMVSVKYLTNLNKMYLKEICYVNFITKPPENNFYTVNVLSAIQKARCLANQ